VISIRGLDKTFVSPGGDRAHALRNVSLDIAEGEWVCVVGTNGSGKSTLLGALAGQFAPDAGTIFIGENDVTKQAEHRRARLVGRVFQDPFRGTCPQLTVLENLRLAHLRGQKKLLRIGLNRRTREEYSGHLAHLKMGLENRAGAQVGTLSGGQRQALTLLMATLSRPQILLLDEHTAALDPSAAERILEITHGLVRENQLTTLMVTHSPRQATDLGDRTVMLHHGRVVRDWSGESRKEKTPQDLLDAFAQLQLESVAL
jgi:putative ABC transport system ATP-binding protein